MISRRNAVFGVAMMFAISATVHLFASEMPKSAVALAPQTAAVGCGPAVNGHRILPGNPSDVKVLGHEDPAVQLSLQRFIQAQADNILADNGEEIVFVYSGDLWVQKVDGTSRRALLLKGSDYAALGCPAWSLDGKSLAFGAIAKNDPRVVDLFTANADGSNPVLVTRLNAGYYSSSISSISWFWDNQWIMFVYGYDAADLTTLFLVCTIQRTGQGLAYGSRPDVIASQYDPTLNSSRYAYTTLGTPLNYNSDLFVSNLNGSNLVNWWHITTIDAFGDVVWIGATTIGAIVRYDAGNPNKELLVKFDRPGSSTSNVVLIYSDVNAKLSSPTFGPTRRKLYMTETTSSVGRLWYSEWGQSWNFITNVQRGYGSSPNWRQALPLPDKVVLASPANNATNVPIRPTLTWNSVPGAGSYHLKVTKVGGAVAYDQQGLTGTSQQVGPLSTGTQFSWTVSATNFAGAGPDSDPFKFTTSLTDVRTAMELPDHFDISENYPNPFNPSTKLEYQIPQAARVEIEVVDVRGSLVRTLHHGTMNPGVYSIEWNGTDRFERNVGSGIYLCRLIARTLDGTAFSQVRKMVVLR